MADEWVDEVEDLVRDFANNHSHTYSKTKRQISGMFEIGCFHALISNYEHLCTIEPKNLTASNEFRYLTTPQGNPENFSYVEGKPLNPNRSDFQIRQQVRIVSDTHEDIYFSPDIVVLEDEPNEWGEYDDDYAHGKQRFFSTTNDRVIAAHECKSLNPFPDLLISFLGTLIPAHGWLDTLRDLSTVSEEGLHLAPTLFVGGTPNSKHSRMSNAIEDNYPINIILGMHYGRWHLVNRRQELNYINFEG